MFSVNQKRQIADAVQKILRETQHPELPKGEIEFSLHVKGAEDWSWADIQNNGAVKVPGVNPWNERNLSADRQETPLSEADQMAEILFNEYNDHTREGAAARTALTKLRLRFRRAAAPDTPSEG